MTASANAPTGGSGGVFEAEAHRPAAKSAQTADAQERSIFTVIFVPTPQARTLRPQFPKAAWLLTLPLRAMFAASYECERNCSTSGTARPRERKRAYPAFSQRCAFHHSRAASFALNRCSGAIRDSNTAINSRTLMWRRFSRCRWGSVSTSFLVGGFMERNLLARTSSL